MSCDDVTVALSGPVRRLDREEIEVLDYLPPERKKVAPRPAWRVGFPRARKAVSTANELR